MSVEFRPARGTLAEIRELEAVLADARLRVLLLEKSNDVAASVYRARRERNMCFGDDADLFGEPAWDMLLDLYTAQMAGREVTITRACKAADVPNTTALRHLGNLEARGLIIRKADHEDRRRSTIQLSEKALTMMQDWLDRQNR